MNWKSERITDASAELITLERAKFQLRVDGTDEDDYITFLIGAVRHAVERCIDRQIGEQVWELRTTCFQSVVELPQQPLLSIVSIKYVLEDGTVKTLEDSEASPVVNCGLYDIDLGEHGRLFLKSGQTWPADVLAQGFPVRYQFKCGITDLSKYKDLEAAMLMLLSHFYEHREEQEDAIAKAATSIFSNINPGEFR